MDNESLDNLSKLLFAYQSDKRLMIRNLLAIHRELSLAELSEHMSMSKHAIHHHLKILREANMVEVSREEESRGSIKRKYFRLVRGKSVFDVDMLDEIGDEEQKLETMHAMLKTLRTIYLDLQYTMDLMINFVEIMDLQLEEDFAERIDSEKLEHSQNLLKVHNTRVRKIRLGEGQMKKYLELKHKFIDDIETIENIADEPYSYLALLVDVPIEKLLEFGKK